MRRADISAPTPNWGQPPSTVTKWFVFITDLMIVSSSIGRIVRRLMTSHCTPICSNSFAASRQTPTNRENDTTVTCLPVTPITVRLTRERRTSIRTAWRISCALDKPRFMPEPAYRQLARLKNQFVRQQTNTDRGTQYKATSLTSMSLAVG